MKYDSGATTMTTETHSAYFCAVCPSQIGRARPTIPVCRGCLSILLLGECGECSAAYEDGGECCHGTFPCHCGCHSLDREAVKNSIIQKAFPHVSFREEVGAPLTTWEEIQSTAD